MKTLLPLLVLPLLALGSLACRSQPDASDAAAVECICGEPIADVEGCPHPVCARGERNPGNPECVCGTLSIPR